MLKLPFNIQKNVSVSSQLSDPNGLLLYSLSSRPKSGYSRKQERMCRSNRIATDLTWQRAQLELNDFCVTVSSKPLTQKRGPL